MSKHITPPPRAGQAGPEAAEPARRASRSDERGIALQTVIIMVVLLAIAGGVAAVLFTRANEATTDLEAQSVTVAAGSIANKGLCTSSGHKWNDGHSAGKQCTHRDIGRFNTSQSICEREGGTYAAGPPATCTDT